MSEEYAHQIQVTPAMLEGLGCRIWGLGFEFQISLAGRGFRIEGLGFMGCGLRAEGLRRERGRDQKDGRRKTQTDGRRE
eukprot:2323760-Rhodomonas_salina.3